jgi:pimeloyl-ACP methyl ester carboxylesterase
MYLMHTPAVVLVHGYGANCGGLSTLEQNIEQELGVAGDRVACFKYGSDAGYDSRKGVFAAAGGLAPFVRGFRQSLDMGFDEEVDLVGHSMGGLVARHYAQGPWSSTDIGSVSMLGTPNEGVWLAKLEKWACAPAALFGLIGLGACFTIDWLDLEDDITGFDPDSQGIHDIKPRSDILINLNEGFTLPEPPELPEYRAHAGRNSSPLGTFLSKSTDNDCVVSLDSVDGPGSGDEALFGDPRLFRYQTLTHGGGASSWWSGCSPPTLTNDMSVVQDLAVTIKGNPVGGMLAAEPLAQGESAGAGGQAPMVMTLADYVEPSQSQTHQISVPGDLGDTSFVVYWLDADENEPILGVTLRRPNEQLVNPGDSDVLGDISVTGDGFLDVLLQGFVMSAPEAGQWSVTVEGLSVPEDGWPYVVVLMPDSNVVLGAGTAEPDLLQGQPQLITATLFDDGAAIPAASVSAVVSTPAGTEEPVVLQDNGSGGDDVAGDLIYSGTFASAADCGDYSVLVTATGDSSEGTVTRQQFVFFDSQVPGDAVRDPCNPDDDADLLSDYDELEVYGTDPLDPDTDYDGMPDGYEAIRTCLDPLVDDAAADPDSDGQSNLAEYGVGTNPCSAGGVVGGVAEPSDIGFSSLHGARKSSPPNVTLLVGAGLSAILLLAGGSWCSLRRRRASSKACSSRGDSPGNT